MGSKCVGFAIWFVPVPTPNECLLSALKRRRPGRIKVELEEIRVCTNRTCRKQGSLQILEILTGLAPPNVAVKSCGCLGRCGSGPNAVLLPDGVLASHCGTAVRAAQVMSAAAANYTGDDDDAIRRTLDALAIRKRAQPEIDQAKFSEAELLLSQAIDLKPFGGLHVIYRYRSVARLGAGNYLGALEDAREALKLAPKYPEVRLIPVSSYFRPATEAMLPMLTHKCEFDETSCENDSIDRYI
uniref:Uncharacterized protein LOC8289783 isoform X4 n=1 Tax=Rhizophora mucronata TaxID=61149 RepID=A0A2P2JE27_RHIMU